MVPRLVQHVRDHLWADLEELQGMTLVCDCAYDTVCEGDILAGLVFEAFVPPPASSVPQRRRRGQGAPLRAVVLAAPGAPSVHSFAAPYMTQEALVLAFRRLYPAAWFAHFQFPYVEDLVSPQPFNLYPRWRSEDGLGLEFGLDPHMATPSVRQLHRAAEGQQAGAAAHKSAVAPLFPFDLSVDARFAQVLQRGDCPLPTEKPLLL